MDQETINDLIGFLGAINGVILWGWICYKNYKWYEIIKISSSLGLFNLIILAILHKKFSMLNKNSK